MAADIENMHKNATVAEWYKNHGKHEIYAKARPSTCRALSILED